MANDMDSIKALSKVLPFSNDTSKHYNMNHRHRGIAVIFNHVDFGGRIPTREGSDVDCERISNELKELSFDVEVAEDFTLEEIELKLYDVANLDHSENDCLVVVVMSHGFEDNQLCAKDETYSTKLLFDAFTEERCETLRGKPKMFFIQACRGSQFDEGVKLYPESIRSTLLPSRRVSTSDGITMPLKADILVMYSTYNNFFSWRNPISGSCFIQALCDEFEEYGKTRDLIQILTGVTRRVAYFYESMVPVSSEMHKMKQCPMIVSTMTKFVFFTEKLSCEKKF